MRNNHLLRSEWIDVLLRTSQWRIVSTIFSPEVPRVTNKQHADWYSGHVDSHMHREVMIVLHGNCVLSLENKFYSAEAGDVFMFDSGEKHDLCYPPWTSNCIHLWFSILQDTILPRLLSIVNGELIQIHGKSEPLFHQGDTGFAFSKAWSMCAGEKSSELPMGFKRERIAGALACLFLDYAGLGFEKEAELTDSASRRTAVIQTIQKHIRDTSGNGISLEHLSTISGYSKYHLLRLFKKHTGMTVHAYINYCRSIRCRELLDNGYRKGEIGDILGFSSPATFSRWLKHDICK